MKRLEITREGHKTCIYIDGNKIENHMGFTLHQPNREDDSIDIPTIEIKIAVLGDIKVDL